VDDNNEEKGRFINLIEESFRSALPRLLSLCYMTLNLYIQSLPLLNPGSLCSPLCSHNAVGDSAENVTLSASLG
jgi:hypothetical protein